MVPISDTEFMGVSIFTYDGGFSRGSVGVLSSRVGVVEDRFFHLLGGWLGDPGDIHGVLGYFHRDL